MGDGVELFCDDGVGRVGPQPGRGKVVEQDRIDRVHRAGRDSIAEADVDLRFAARLRQFARDDHADTTVAGFLADFLDGDGGRVEHDTVVHGNGGDLAEHPRDRFQIARAEAQQVGVARGPMRHVIPERKQQRAFQQKAIRVLRLRQAVEDALQRETYQYLIEIDALRLGDVEQAGTNRSRDIAHSIASRYGRITLATRQSFA